MRRRIAILLAVLLGLMFFYETAFRYVTTSCGEIDMEARPPRVYYSDDLLAPFPWRSAFFGFRTQLPLGKVRLSKGSGASVDGGRFYHRLPDGRWRDMTTSLIDYQTAKASLLGLWQTETVRAAVPGGTHAVEAHETVEFLKDRSFKMSIAASTDGQKQSGVVLAGTYALVNTNHVRLEVASNLPGSTNKTPLTVQFSIVGDQLEMSKLIPSVVPETQMYRRVK